MRIEAEGAMTGGAPNTIRPLPESGRPRVVILGLTLIVIAVQVFFSAFLLGVLQIPVMQQRVDRQ